MPRRKQDLRRAAAQVEPGIPINLAVRIHQVGSMKERSRLAAFPASLVGDRIVELCDLGLKLIGRPHCRDVAPHVDSPLAKEAVPANVIEMFLRIDYSHLVPRPRGGSVSMDGLRR